MKQEMYSNIIGKEVWNKCQNCKIWISDYLAKIEANGNHLYDRIDIYYDSKLEPGEIKNVRVVWYCDNPIISVSGEEYCDLSVFPLDEQKEIFDWFMKELPFVK